MTAGRMLAPAALALFVLAASGCGAGTAKVTGKVTLDGAPVENGTILFTPKDGKGQSATGVIKKDRKSTRLNSSH